MYSQQQHKRWHLKGSTLAKCSGYINSVCLKALLAFTVWAWMYNNETEREDGEEREEGRQRAKKKSKERRRRESFMSPLSLKCLPFMWALSSSVCSRSICPTSLSHDKDITFLVQGGQHRSCATQVSVCMKEMQQTHIQVKCWCVLKKLRNICVPKTDFFVESHFYR